MILILEKIYKLLISSHLLNLFICSWNTCNRNMSFSLLKHALRRLYLQVICEGHVWSSRRLRSALVFWICSGLSKPLDSSLLLCFGDALLVMFNCLAKSWAIESGSTERRRLKGPSEVPEAWDLGGEITLNRDLQEHFTPPNKINILTHTGANLYAVINTYQWNNYCRIEKQSQILRYKLRIARYKWSEEKLQN